MSIVGAQSSSLLSSHNEQKKQLRNTIQPVLCASLARSCAHVRSTQAFTQFPTRPGTHTYLLQCQTPTWGIFFFTQNFVAGFFANCTICALFSRHFFALSSTWQSLWRYMFIVFFLLISLRSLLAVLLNQKSIKKSYKINKNISDKVKQKN